MIARYFDTASDAAQAVALESHAQLESLLSAVAEASPGDRGTPTVELARSTGAGALVIGQAARGIVLLYVDDLGASWHSVGGEGEDVMVVDHFGSYTEIPAQFFVPPALGRAAAHAFVESGSPFVHDLTMEPD